MKGSTEVGRDPGPVGQSGLGPAYRSSQGSVAPRGEIPLMRWTGPGSSGAL